MRLRQGSKGAVALVALFLVAACGACGSCKKTDGAPPGSSLASSAGGSGDASLAREDAAPPRDARMWSRASDGGIEDLATLAVHEGAMGLVEAAEQDRALRSTAIRAMAHAPGWAQAPFLAKVAEGKDDDEARAALDALVDLAARPRRSEDPEDADELAEACEKLVALARDATRAKDRRVPAIRAHRMMPCPKADLPTDLDAR